jgi:hypothetical protein
MRRAPYCLLTGAAFLMITKEKFPIRPYFSFVIMELLPTITRPAGAARGAGSGAEPVRYL